MVTAIWQFMLAITLIGNVHLHMDHIRDRITINQCYVFRMSEWENAIAEVFPILWHWVYCHG